MGFQGQFYTNVVQGLRMPPAFAPLLILWLTSCFFNGFSVFRL